MKVLTIRIEMGGEAFKGTKKYDSADFEVREILRGLVEDIYHCGLDNAVGTLGASGLKDRDGNTCGSISVAEE